MSLLWLAFAVLTAASPDRVRATLGSVIDGDTIQVCMEGKRERDRIRFLRVNTPEIDDPAGRAAAAALRELLHGCALELEGERGSDFERDRFGRALAYVWCGPTNLNVELVRQGRTRFWTRYGAGRYARDFQLAEETVRRAGRGLWAIR